MADHHHESVIIKPSEASSKRAHVGSMDEYNAMYKRSIEDPAGFWGEIANQFYWEQAFDASKPITQHNYDIAKGKVEISWFPGGTTNICYNTLDRHVKAGKGDTVAFHWVGNEPGEKKSFTYAQMLERVCKFSNVLKSHGVKKGDAVALYMPMVIELVIAMLACARIGAVHSIVFGGFSAEALADRIADCQCAVVVTADGSFRGKKPILLKKIADSAIDLCAARGFEVKVSIVARNLEGKGVDAPAWVEGRDFWFQEAEDAASSECEVTWVGSEDPLFLLYTSGSTGKPKGVLHTVGGYMVWTATTLKYTFDYHENDVFWCTADIGWITGHSYITYGPMLNGATSVMFEGIPTYPDAGRWWQIVQDYKINQFYTAPTAIRALQSAGDDFPAKYDLSTLRVLGTVGEPINPEAWNWYYEVIGRGNCPIVDTWWQTETGGHMITSLPGATPMKPGSASLPFFGVVPAIVDEQGKELTESPCEGYLVIKQPWPGQMRTIFGDHERFQNVYFTKFPKYYFSGDGCRRDAEGYYWITGRTDDVINVSGHRIGTAELESAIARHEAVAESAIIGVPHDIKGQTIYVFVICQEGVEFNADVAKSMRQTVRSEIGAFAAPEYIQNVPSLPKTRSGKIMRRILRKIATKMEAELGDCSTLADPDVIQALLDTRKDVIHM